MSTPPVEGFQAESSDPAPSTVLLADKLYGVTDFGAKRARMTVEHLAELIDIVLDERETVAIIAEKLIDSILRFNKRAVSSMDELIQYTKRDGLELEETAFLIEEAREMASATSESYQSYRKLLVKIGDTIRALDMEPDEKKKLRTLKLLLV